MSAAGDGGAPARAALQAALGYRFSEPALLETALTHRSHAHEAGAARSAHYERLEFLGDALLGFLVSDWLYAADLDAAEGVLSRRRQTVVRTSTLARAAERLGLGEAIRIGRGEERTGGRDKPSLLADAFEAVLAAIYLDGGIRPARAFVRRHLGTALRLAAEAQETADDFKTRLQERVQGSLQQTPRYRIVSTAGPAHALEFEVEVLVRGEVLGRGTGTNRKRAEQQAARQALQRLDEAGE
ncbi:MAG TPA: ribonuclease III [Candidatus Polarisedimenticolaceae bacterium]|nr:ribonuclease III [Candidatus Polarisedimenticolaceae bacterium]